MSDIIRRLLNDSRLPSDAIPGDYLHAPSMADIMEKQDGQPVDQEQLLTKLQKRMNGQPTDTNVTTLQLDR